MDGVRLESSPERTGRSASSVAAPAPAASGVAAASLPLPAGQQDQRELAASYAWCRRLTRRSRSSFYYSFFTLSRDLFRDMCVLYAFMRVSDDLGDDASASAAVRGERIEQWQEQVRLAFDERRFEHPLLAALTDVVARRAIPVEHFFAVIDGVRQDLDPRGFETFAELSDYCDHVAGAVGLCCIHIWGFSDPAAIPLALECGRAFQLTNILRDVAEDARMRRCYLPREDLRRFGLTVRELPGAIPDGRFRRLMAWEAERAREYFDRARPLVRLCSPAGRPVLEAMMNTYSVLLDALEDRGFDSRLGRVQLSRWRKASIVLAAFVRHRLRRAD